jgi:hypothetical protein
MPTVTRDASSAEPIRKMFEVAQQWFATTSPSRPP